MQATRIPEIELPFPARLHLHVDRLERHARDWADEFQLVRSATTIEALQRMRVGHFAGSIYPAAPFPEAEIVADWLLWLYVADDEYEEGRYHVDEGWTALVDAVREVIIEGRAGGSLAQVPLIRALADLSTRLDRLVTPAWKHRFASHLLDTMASVLRELALRSEGVPPALTEYVSLRRRCGAVIPSFDLIEVCAGVELPAEVYESSAYQAVCHAAVDVICWTNDLYSLDKEIACGIVSNLVLVLEHERALAREQALEAARTLIAERVDDLLAAERRASEWADSARLDARTEDVLDKCLTGVREWVAGSNRWHSRVTGRFAEPRAAGFGSVAEVRVPALAQGSR